MIIITTSTNIYIVFMISIYIHTCIPMYIYTYIHMYILFYSPQQSCQIVIIIPHILGMNKLKAREWHFQDYTASEWRNCFSKSLTGIFAYIHLYLLHWNSSTLQIPPNFSVNSEAIWHFAHRLELGYCIAVALSPLLWPPGDACCYPTRVLSKARGMQVSSPSIISALPNT